MMLRRSFTKSLPAALVAPSLTPPSVDPIGMPMPVLLSFPHLVRDELPTLTGKKCYVLRPDGVVLSSSFWRYTLQNIEDGSILEEAKGISFEKDQNTLEELCLMNASSTMAIMFELHVTCSDAEVFAFCSKEELHAAIASLEHWDAHVAKYGHHDGYDPSSLAP